METDFNRLGAEEAGDCVLPVSLPESLGVVC